MDDITHVINYNLPDEIESYTHRSGRTGRAGKTGVSILIISPREIGKIKAVERIIKKQFTQAPIPSGIEICERQLMKVVKDIRDIKVDESAIAKYLPTIMEQLQDMDKEELIKRFVFDEFNRFLEYYKKFPNLNSTASEYASNPNSNRLFVNLGRLDGFTREQLMDYLNQATAIKPSPVTNLELKHSFSFIDIDPNIAANFSEEMSKMVFKGRKIRVGKPERAEGGGGYQGGDGGERSSSRGRGSYSGGGGRREGGRSSGGYSGNGGRSRSSESGSRSSSGGGYSGGGSSSGGGAKREGGKRPRNKYGSGGGGSDRSDRFKK